MSPMQWIKNLAAALLVWFILGWLGYMIYLGVVGHNESRERQQIEEIMKEMK